MSVFFRNICQSDNCGREFNTRHDLIVHIESHHIDFSKAEQLEGEMQDCPMSYVLKYGGSETSPPQYSCQNEASCLNKAVIQELDDVSSEEATPLNNNYLSCDNKEVKKMNVCEARLNADEVPPVLGNSNLFTVDHSYKKPFACNMNGCEKRYKNVNGIKYHYKKHHKMLIHTPKKSLLKHKSIPKPKIEKHDLHGIPLYSYKPSMPADRVHPIIHMGRFEETDVSYKYTLPTSDVHFPSTQVPLPNNMSFNYYEVGDTEDFQVNNSAHLDKF